MRLWSRTRRSPVTAATPLTSGLSSWTCSAWTRRKPPRRATSRPRKNCWRKSAWRAATSSPTACCGPQSRSSATNLGPGTATWPWTVPRSKCPPKATRTSRTCWQAACPATARSPRPPRSATTQRARTTTTATRSPPKATTCGQARPPLPPWKATVLAGKGDCRRLFSACPSTARVPSRGSVRCAR